MKRVIMSVLIISFIMGCANGSGMKVMIKPALDKRLKEIKPISLHAGLFIEPAKQKLKSNTSLSNFERRRDEVFILAI